MNDGTRLLVKVATLYYRGQLSQLEIAQRLGISRQTVGRLLQRALDQGIVHIDIHSPLSYSTELEVEMEAMFSLAESVVILPPADTDHALKESLGEAAAEFIQRRIKNGDILGVVSGSSTLYEFALHLKPAHIQNLTVVALTGSAPALESPSEPYIQPIGPRVAANFGGKSVTLPAPSFVDGPEIKKSLLSDSNIAGVLALAEQANIALVGIGTMSEQSFPYKHGYLDVEALKLVRTQGAVGEICGHAYDINGHPCSPEISSRAIALDLASLCTKTLSIAVAGGVTKLDAIWGALQGRYCNVLITDHITATQLLERGKARRS